MLFQMRYYRLQCCKYSVVEIVAKEYNLPLRSSFNIPEIVVLINLLSGDDLFAVAIIVCGSSPTVFSSLMHV